MSINPSLGFSWQWISSDEPLEYQGSANPEVERFNLEGKSSEPGFDTWQDSVESTSEGSWNVPAARKGKKAKRGKR